MIMTETNFISTAATGTNINGMNGCEDYSRWWRIYRKVEHPNSRLICLPHAGGSASFYRNWAQDLPTNIELAAIQYPGHEDRLNEPLVNDMNELVNGICDSACRGGLLNRPYMIFGHSMGGYVAYELCREIRKRGLKEPYHVFISSSEAPGLKNDSNWHESSDTDLLTEVRRVYGDDNICRDAEIADMFLPVIRNDYELIEKWNPEKNQEPFKIDLSSFYADADTEMDRMKAEGWQNVTSRKFEARKFNGNHFYLIQHRREIIRSVADAARRQNTKRLMLP